MLRRWDGKPLKLVSNRNVNKVNKPLLISRVLEKLTACGVACLFVLCERPMCDC